MLKRVGMCTGNMLDLACHIKPIAEFGCLYKLQTLKDIK